MNSPLGSWYLPYVIAKHWRGVTNRRRLLIFGILSPAVSYLLFHLELEEADPSAVPKTCELSSRNQGGLGEASRQYPRLCKTAEISHLKLSTIPCEGDYGSTAVQTRKLRHRLEMGLICLEPDRAKMAPEIMYANSSLTRLPPNTSFLPGYLRLCQITWQHTASLILYKYHCFFHWQLQVSICV